MKHILLAKLSILILLFSPMHFMESTNTGMVNQISIDPASTDSIIKEKNYYLLALINRHAELRQALASDVILKEMISRQWQRVKTALQQCADLDCLCLSVQWNEVEIQQAADALVNICKTGNSFKKVISLLRQSGYCNACGTIDDTSLLKKVWVNEAEGINRVINVYINRGRPRYPKIDAIAFSAGDKAFRNRVFEIVEKENARKSGDALFYTLPLYTALAALRLNGRDEAARYEPLNSGMNSLPVVRLRSINWSRYPYSVILVPGHGPDAPGIAIDSLSKYRCGLALKSYREGNAPFIIVSGGHVHPAKTVYCEAVEMKKYLVQQLGVPDEAVIIEPHARHTTTNLRNVNRLLFRWNIPAEKPLLVVSDSSQCRSISSIGKRCERELGYIPFKNMELLTAESIEYIPLACSLQANSFDPLDP